MDSKRKKEKKRLKEVSPQPPCPVEQSAPAQPDWAGLTGPFSSWIAADPPQIAAADLSGAAAAAASRLSHSWKGGGI